MGEEEENVHCLSSTECTQNICTCLHGHALSFTCFWCVYKFCLYHTCRWGSPHSVAYMSPWGVYFSWSTSSSSGPHSCQDKKLKNVVQVY